MSLTLEIVEAALLGAGLTPRGAFNPAPDDGVPEASPGVAAGTLVLAGNAGPHMWQAFAAERDPAREPLDAWSKAKLGPLAESFGGRAFYPFEPPHLPFQRWARKAEACHHSPLGIFIHPEYGLWHGYRGALALPETLALPAAKPSSPPCESCAEKPCLSTCPVGASTAAGYDVPACADHLETAAGADCMAEGCRARRACPVGRGFRYVPAQAAFHMRAFLQARREAR
ncbi:MAG: ferredoxin [Rhodospirillaceae bacterium]